MPRNTLNKSHKRGSVTMLYITLGILALILWFVLAQAVHHAQPDTASWDAASGMTSACGL
jgi:hypothetical protein